MKKTKHHLFTYYEIRLKLIEILGEPKTDEDHKKLHTEIKRVRKLIPVYEIDHDFHNQLHKNELEYNKELKKLLKLKNKN